MPFLFLLFLVGALSQGLFDAAKHRKTESAGGSPSFRAAEPALRHFGQAPSVPMEGFDLLTKENHFILHDFKLEIRPRRLECFYVYLAENYDIKVDVESEETSAFSATFRSPQGRVLARINSLGEHTNGYFTLKGLPAGFHELCIHTMGTFMNAITVNVNMFITIMDDADPPWLSEETVPPSKGNRTDNENDEAAMAEEDMADELRESMSKAIDTTRMDMFHVARTIMQMKIFHGTDEALHNEQSEQITTYSIVIIAVVVSVTVAQVVAIRSLFVNSKSAEEMGGI